MTNYTRKLDTFAKEINACKRNNEESWQIAMSLKNFLKNIDEDILNHAEANRLTHMIEVLMCKAGRYSKIFYDNKTLEYLWDLEDGWDKRTVILAIWSRAFILFNVTMWRE